MKTKLQSILFTLIIYLVPIFGFTQCPSGEIFLTSQAEVDAFSLQYPDCTELTYALSISGTDVTDLSSLSQITKIFQLYITNTTSLVNLTGLNNINDLFAPASVFITNNSILSDASALNGINSNNVLDIIEIKNNPQLIDLQGFDWVRNPQYLYVINNDSLQNLNGLGLVSSQDTFEIKENDSMLNFIGLESTTFIGGFVVENNNNLIDFSGLTNLEFLGGLEALNNDSLINLSGLDGVLSGNYFTFKDNASLLSLNGLTMSTEIFGLTLENNNQLTDISSFSGVSFFDNQGVSILNNQNLSLCNIQSICSALTFWNPSTQITIEGNASGCGSLSEVALACGVVPYNDDCEEAIQVNIGETLVAYNEFATLSPQVPSCNDFNRIDVWFKVSSDSFSSMDITVDADYNIQLWEGTCSNLTQVSEACGEGALMDISVNTNTDYYIQVWSDSTTGRMSGLFNIVVQDATLSTVESEFDKIKLYPNPTRNILNLKTPENIDFVNITNLLGQQILRIEPNTTDAKIDLSNLNSGMYLILIQVKGKSQIYRIIKS